MAKLHAMHLYYLKKKEALRKLEETRVAVEFCGTEQEIQSLNNLSNHYRKELEYAKRWADPNYRPKRKFRPAPQGMLNIDGEWMTKDSYYHKSHY